jgi:hypothetical protein
VKSHFLQWILLAVVHAEVEVCFPLDDGAPISGLEGIVFRFHSMVSRLLLPRPFFLKKILHIDKLHRRSLSFPDRSRPATRNIPGVEIAAVLVYERSRIPAVCQMRQSE